MNIKCPICLELFEPTSVIYATNCGHVFHRNCAVICCKVLLSFMKPHLITRLYSLALVWATKHFRCYLHGRKFVARMDHSALTYLRNFADQNSRLLRRSIKLSELHFVVEHRAGTKMAHAEALRRHVGTVVHGGTPEKDQILKRIKNLKASLRTA